MRSRAIQILSHTMHQGKKSGQNMEYINILIEKNIYVRAHRVFFKHFTKEWKKISLVQVFLEVPITLT